MLIHCPTCAAVLNIPDADFDVKATLACSSCGRTVVARDADVAPHSAGELTMPFAPAVAAPSKGEQTLVAGRGPSLSLPRNGRVSLAILSGPRSGDVLVLSRPQVTIGRVGGGADLEVPDPEISRRHATLECYGERFALRDEGSRNGTFVNERKIDVVRLEGQGEFRLGATRFLVIFTENG